MSTQEYTPGPWKTGTAECRSLDAVFGPIAGINVTVGVIANCGAVARSNAENVANARLIAAAPDLLAELRDTADWIDERAVVLREIAGGSMVGGTRRQQLRDEAARHNGRAAVIRQTILTATGA